MAVGPVLNHFLLSGRIWRFESLLLLTLFDVLLRCLYFCARGLFLRARGQNFLLRCDWLRISCRFTPGEAISTFICEWLWTYGHNLGGVHRGYGACL